MQNWVDEAPRCLAQTLYAYYTVAEPDWLNYTVAFGRAFNILP